MTVQLDDAFGNPVAATDALTVVLSTTSANGTFTPLSPLTIAAGASTTSFQYADTLAGTPTITATTDSLGPAMQQETVNPAAASQLVFTTSPQTMTAGVASGTITVAEEDAFGNFVTSTQHRLPQFDFKLGRGLFTPASPLTIPAGADSVTFHYTDTLAGTPTLTVATGSLTSATQTETVNPAVASKLAFITPSRP